MKSILTKPGQWPLTVAVVIVIISMWLLPQQWSRYRNASRAVEQTRSIMDITVALLSSLKDAETGQRGYLITHDRAYLTPYEEGVASVPGLLESLRTSLAQSLDLELPYQRVAQRTYQKLAELERIVSIARAGRFDEAVAQVQLGTGKRLMDDIRHEVSEIERRQSESLSLYNRESEQFARSALAFSGLSALLLFGFLLSATLTARRAHEKALANQSAWEESEGRFRSIADAAPVLIWTSRLDKKWDYLNKGWLEFTGRSLEQELGEGWKDNIYPEDIDTAMAAYSQAFDSRKPFKVEFRLRRHDGQYRWIVNHGIPIVRNNRTFVGYIGSCIDIHDLKNLQTTLEDRVNERTEQLRYKEQELMQSRKIEAIGRLAGGVAHDFNNLLTGIFGVVDQLHEELAADDPHREAVDEIMQAARRASSLTKQLLAFGRRQMVAPIVINLNSVLSEMTSMLKRLIGEDIQLVSALAADLGTVRMDPGQVEQIVINLVLNARDAMPNGGKITIETANVELDETYSKKHFEVVPGPHVLLAISDTGMGMDARTQEQAFEPFFTTKAKGTGSGMGLASVYGIVKQNNGDIFLYSTPGTGTSVKIYLPRIFDPATPMPVTPATIQGRETILLVEDEEMVRRTAKNALQRAGYRILEARHGKEAVEIVANFDGSIDLLLTDVIMPGLNGRQLAEVLAPQRPDMKVLYTSGYTENIIVQRGMLKPGIAFIEKSFSGADLCKKVREVLDTPVPS